MDDFGIVYLIENAQQFWSELDDVLRLPSAPTLSRLDSTLRRFVSLCATYHEQFLQNTMQIEHACDNLLQSELFAFHSERMCELLSDDAQSTTDPHIQLVLYNICLLRGRQNSSFLRSHKRWQPLIPLLMDHIQVDVDPEVQGIYTGSAIGSNSGHARGIIIPIEAKIRSLSVRLLYEVCRVQKFSLEDLRVFRDSFLEYLFDLVEQTRDAQDESFNYSVIKLIVALNEQFMVASLPSHVPNKSHLIDAPESKDQGDNRVLGILMRRLGSSQTFSENLIFMLNRAGRSPEDLCMQLLVLKLLYILFITKGTSEYFYTNDLCVLVDVILREVVDLDEDSESLRHTYLRVLHPLLTKTQLRDYPYKRPQIVRALESLVANANIRDINPTTKRLVDRCMGGDWCVQFRKTNLSMYSPNLQHARNDSPGAIAASNNLLSPASQALKQKPIKSIKSAENMRNAPASQKDTRTPVRKFSSESATSLPNVISAKFSPVTRRKERAGSVDADSPTQDQDIVATRSGSLGALDDMDSPTRFADDSAITGRRSAPLPPKRRKPPAVPTDAKKRTHGSAIITTIASSSTSSPLAHQSTFRL